MSFCSSELALTFLISCPGATIRSPEKKWKVDWRTSRIYHICIDSIYGPKNNLLKWVMIEKIEEDHQTTRKGFTHFLIKILLCYKNISIFVRASVCCCYERIKQGINSGHPMFSISLTQNATGCGLFKCPSHVVNITHQECGRLWFI